MLSYDDLSPYVSVTLFSIGLGNKFSSFPERILSAEARGLFRFDKQLGIKKAGKSARTRRHSMPSPPSVDAGSGGPWFCVYVERRPASWLKRSSLASANRYLEKLYDYTHHIVVVVAKEPYLAIYASETAGRDIVEKIILADDALDAARIAPERLHKAFTLAPAKTLWLTGVHRPTDRKPSSKTLVGSSLQASLDPLDDQTYSYSAARCGDAEIFGVTPRRSRVWLKPSKDWADFIAGIEKIMDRISNPATQSISTDGIDYNLLGVLASAEESPVAVSGPYAMAITPLDWVDPGADVHNQDELELLEKWATRGTYTISPSAPQSEVASAFDVDVHLDNSLVVKLSVELAYADNARLAATCIENEVSSPDDASEITSLICKGDALRVWFDSGHSLESGRVFAMKHRDMRFVPTWDDFGRYPIDIEKPTRLITELGKPDRRVYDPKAIGVKPASLFCWIKSGGSSTIDVDKGWLLCDDGSMEVADFIHYCAIRRRLTLIHVKAASNASADRGISVGDYEVVSAQATKNINWFNTARLATRLAARKGGIAWLDGEKGSWATATATIASAPDNISKRLIIVQPAMRENAWQDARAEQDNDPAVPSNKLIRMRQLDLLLLTVDRTCRARGIDLFVVAQKNLSQLA